MKSSYPVIVWTQVFNGAKTLARAIESVLNQTYADFTYYCLDHASTDSTSEIIRNYAQRDPRVVYLREDVNLMGIRVKHFLEFLKKHGNDTLVVTLDADDLYAPDFLEKMTRFRADHNLDIAFAHSRRIEMHGGYANITLPETIAVDTNEFVEQYFSTHYLCTTTFWKNISFLRNMIACIQNMSANVGVRLDVPYNGGHMIDNLCMLEHLKLVSRIGCLSEYLHTQYVNPEQLTNNYGPDRYTNILQIKESMLRFLEMFGPISKENSDLVNIRFITLLKFTLAKLFHAQCERHIKLRDTISIFSDVNVREVLSLDFESAGIRTDKLVFLDWIIAFASKDDEPDTEDCEPLKSVLVAKIEDLKRTVLT